VDLGLCKVRLMTNNPAKRVGIESYGLEVVERIPLNVGATEENSHYLRTKREKMGHLLDEPAPEGNGSGVTAEGDTLEKMKLT
jgi:3,4-dihydroxy 2-butanone 4-phosphate synthase / GTP cyclohydrolase II